MKPRTAMVLAAGLATRMRPLTDHTAKPLLTLGGQTLLDHALDRLHEVGVETVAVNAFWQADRVAAHLAARARPPKTVLKRETALLDTGGGVCNALDVLGPDPFYVINGDAVWLDGPMPALTRLARAWTDDIDAILLLQRTFQVHGEVGAGDFALDPVGVPCRRREREDLPAHRGGAQGRQGRLRSRHGSGPRRRTRHPRDHRPRTSRRRHLGRGIWRQARHIGFALGARSGGWHPRLHHRPP